MLASLSRWGNSLGVRIPKALAQEVGLEDGAQVVITAENGRIVILPARPRYSLEQLLENVTPEAMREAFDWGPDLGREVVDE